MIISPHSLPDTSSNCAVSMIFNSYLDSYLE